jgi:hypothetical protein
MGHLSVRDSMKGTLGEALASLVQTYLGSFFFDAKDIRKLSTGAIWNFAKGTGLL